MSLMSVISSSCQSRVTHSSGTQCNTSYFNHDFRTEAHIISPIGRGWSQSNREGLERKNRK